MRSSASRRSWSSTFVGGVLPDAPKPGTGTRSIFTPKPGTSEPLGAPATLSSEVSPPQGLPPQDPPPKDPPLRICWNDSVMTEIGIGLVRSIFGLFLAIRSSMNLAGPWASSGSIEPFPLVSMREIKLEGSNPPPPNPPLKPPLLEPPRPRSPPRSDPPPMTIIGGPPPPKDIPGGWARAIRSSDTPPKRAIATGATRDL